MSYNCGNNANCVFGNKTKNNYASDYLKNKKTKLLIVKKDSKN